MLFYRLSNLGENWMKWSQTRILSVYTAYTHMHTIQNTHILDTALLFCSTDVDTKSMSMVTKHCRVVTYLLVFWYKIQNRVKVCVINIWFCVILGTTFLVLSLRWQSAPWMWECMWTCRYKQWAAISHTFTAILLVQKVCKYICRKCQ